MLALSDWARSLVESRVPECGFCFCENLPNETVVFLTVGPHDRAYAIREELAGYT